MNDVESSVRASWRCFRTRNLEVIGCTLWASQADLLNLSGAVHQLSPGLGSVSITFYPFLTQILYSPGHAGRRHWSNGLGLDGKSTPLTPCLAATLRQLSAFLGLLHFNIFNAMLLQACGIGVHDQ